MLLKTNLESAIFMVVLAVKNKKDGLKTVFPRDPRGIFLVLIISNLEMILLLFLRW